MDLSEYTEQLAQDIAALTRLGGDEVARAGELIADSADAPIRLALLGALSAATAEINGRLQDASVEMQLFTDGPGFFVYPQPDEAPPHRPPGPADDEAGEPDEGGNVSRVTLRLAAGTKNRAEEMAKREGISLNAWLARAIQRALDDAAPPGQPKRSSRGPGQRITGFARS